MTDCFLLKEIQIPNNSEVDEDVIMVLTLIRIIILIVQVMLILSDIS